MSNFSGRLAMALATAEIHAEDRKALAAMQKLFASGGRPDGSALLRIAGLLQIDPRWLARGIHSPAGAAACAAMAVFPGVLRLHQRHVLMKYLAQLEEPSRHAGECRYCSCTDQHGCGDCTWVDDAATICSACLEGEE